METVDNEVLQALSARKSVRVYTDEPVTEAERNAILQAAFQAPTAGNQQLYTILNITDPALIEKTGGIVQGMSGSPIIQNGMFVGAVTHVFVNDPTRGYAIFGETMLEGSINTVCSTK